MIILIFHRTFSQSLKLQARGLLLVIINNYVNWILYYAVPCDWLLWFAVLNICMFSIFWQNLIRVKQKIRFFCFMIILGWIFHSMSHVPCGLRYTGTSYLICTSLLLGDSSSKSEAQYSLMQFLNLDMTGKVWL